MKTTLHTDWTVGDVCKGFVFDRNEGKGLFGLDGQLIIQPEYQRNYIYGDGKRDVARCRVPVEGLSARLDLLREERRRDVRGSGRAAAHHVICPLREQVMAVRS